MRAPVALIMALSVVAFAGPAQAGAARKAPRERTGVWVTAGVNSSNVQRSEKNCPGGQLGLAVGRELYLRLQRTSVSFEQSDGTDTCDGGIVGDSSLTENALTGGVMLGNSGLFLGAGPARVHADIRNVLEEQRDSGMRIEFGWTSRKRPDGLFGGEILAFHTDNDIASYAGLAFNLAFGLRW